MSRLVDTFQTGPMTDGITNPMLNLAYGGQFGFAPNIAQYVYSASYVSQNLICLLMEAPRAYQYLPDPQGMIIALKNLVETHPKSITGLQRGLRAEFAETAIGGGGEMQEDMTDMKRERSTISMSYVEKYGRPIQTFVEENMLLLGMDPDTKVPGICTLLGVKPTDLLPDMISSTMLFMEPDPTHQFVTKAWLTTNMQLKQTGDITAKRDLTSAKETNEFTLEWTGISQSGLGIRLFANALLNQINLANANPYLQAAFIEGVQADVAAANVGYQVGAEDLGSRAVVSRG